VDPLDGTTNFAHGHPVFAVSMGLYAGREGLVGVVAAPAMGVTWWAARGHGCFRNGVPCRVTNTDALGDALCATGFPYDKWTNPDHNVRELDAFLTRTHGVRRGGSAAVDLAMVADGTFDLYWEQRLSPWDMAAGAVLVSEAGGTLSDYDGTAGDPLKGRLVATNGHLHAETLAVLQRARRGPART
jgi:myo-inositol-1(or 4)-monophosphatase